MSAELRRVAEEAARNAGGYLREVFRGEMRVDYKRDRHDLVTEHDRHSEDMIVPFLLNRVPDSVVVGEEGGSRGSGSRVTWYVDPIDGTSNFAQGLAFFCVSIAAEIAGEVVAGAIYDPMADLMFSADDAAAYLNDAPLRTPPALPAEDATLITGYPSALDMRQDGSAALADFGELVAGFSSLRRTGSGALTLAHVAAGWVDAGLGSSGHPWDYAAGMLIVRRAGGTYLPLRHGTAPTDGPDHLAPGYVALAPGADYPVLDAMTERLLGRRQTSSGEVPAR